MPSARRLKIIKDGSVIAGVIQKSISIAGEPLDITDDASNAWRTFDEDVGRRSIDISIEGVASTHDNSLRTAILAQTPNLLFKDLIVEYPNGDRFQGDFWMSSLEESGPENDKLGFSATLQSSGVMTFTANTQG